MLDIQPLLDEILPKKAHYERLILQSGEHFNIFNILGLSTKEVRLHSNFLAELLNPDGSHGMGVYFLEKFIQHLQHSKIDIFASLSLFQTGGAYVEVEYNIGPGNKDLSAGGRIDILIRDKKGKAIIIENKIHAGDQFNQMIRYDGLRNKAALIYLTPEGGPPSTYSAGTLAQNVNFICLSYKKDILEWLTECLGQGPGMPETVRYTIQQYIWLLKQITKQSNTSNMTNDIVSTLDGSDANIESAFLVASHLDQLKSRRAGSILAALQARLSEHGFPYKIPHFLIFPRIEIYPDRWKNHLIGFTEENGMLFGIKRVDEKRKTISFNEIKVDVPDNFRTSSWWLCYSYLRGKEFDLDTHHPWLHQNEAEVARKMAEQINLLRGIALKTNDLPW